MFHLFKFIEVRTLLDLTSTCKDYYRLLSDDIWKSFLLKDYEKDYKSHIYHINKDNENNLKALENINKSTEIFESLKEYELSYINKFKELRSLDLLFDDQETDIKYRKTSIKDAFKEVDDLQLRLMKHLNKYILEKPLEVESDSLKLYKEFYEKSKYTTCKYPIYSYFNCNKKTLAFGKFCEEHTMILNRLKIENDINFITV